LGVLPGWKWFPWPGLNRHPVIGSDSRRHIRLVCRVYRKLRAVPLPINVLIGSCQPSTAGFRRILLIPVKRWLTGTLHYAVTPEHLAYYLDEYTFRFNRRKSKSRGLLFYRLLQQAVNTDPHPLAELRNPVAAVEVPF